MSSSPLRRVSALARRTAPIAALILALTATLVGPPGQANAAPRQHVVVFGDSYSANNPDSIEIGTNCGKSPTSWPAQLQRVSRYRINNEACAGSSLYGGYNVYDQANRARKRGLLNKNTRAVLIQLGFNDFGGGQSLFPRCLAIGCPGGEQTFPRLNTAEYAKRLRPLVAFIEYYSPKATIAIVGYPEIFTPGARGICARAAGVPVAVPNTNSAPAFMTKLQRVQKEAAARLGTRFVDLQAATRGHGLCAESPWVQGIFYPHPGVRETTLLGHPTVVGDRVAATTVKRTVGV